MLNKTWLLGQQDLLQFDRMYENVNRKRKEGEALVSPRTQKGHR